MRNIQEVIAKLTLEEKASLCGGAGFWNTAALPQRDIPAMMLTDGPHGLRKQPGEADHLGLNESTKTTCFPTAAGLACSWNPELARKIGAAIGEECQAEDVQIILGPGANIKRSPLCGRNFEYYSEDPYLSSKLAAGHIAGVQSQGVGTSLKHFAVNNQETKRFNIDAVVDERTLREIYLASFEGAVKASQPWTVMCAYNKINGEFCSQNKMLLTDILKNEWGFEGFVVSDWFATSERDLGLLAGLDLEMPTSAGAGAEKIVNAVENGAVPEAVLDASVERLLKIIFKSVEQKKANAVYDRESHHALAREAARESMVLLKNEGNILPLGKSGSIAVIGAFAKQPRYQGAGSSQINPTRFDIPYDEIVKTAGGAAVSYADGYSLDGETDGAALRDAVKTAASADVCVVFAGLPGSYDSEGSDRKHMSLPAEQNTLIAEIAKAQKKVVVVLFNGSAVEMPWLSQVEGVLEAYLGGQAMAGAVADILFGDCNPCGKLAETFPAKLSDTPCFINFPGESTKVEYREGLFVGYRHYDKAAVEPLFPFGHGLSYTSFEYSDMRLDKNELTDAEELRVTVTVKNTGSRAGKEIVQLYVADRECSVIRPAKELKGFAKISLNPGESGEVFFTLGKRAFAFYDTRLKDWRVESGAFDIITGKSSRDIQLKETVNVSSTAVMVKNYTLDSTIADVKNEPAAAGLVSMMSSGLQGGHSLGMDMDALLSSVKLRSIVAMSSMGSQSADRPSVTEKDLLALVDAMNG
ncbi:MAG: glycoside hydrolase family 3 C-terminal domain-containing protein [Oscillospiraceae bacterium]|jgi:beta-glucosidase|nr:glycoside hydrolase family 3 C-terminal domain-containing protein [Oscillospiraceae bacterium]